MYKLIAKSYLTSVRYLIVPIRLEFLTRPQCYILHVLLFITGYLISKSALNNLNDGDLDLQANDSSIKNLAANHPTEGFSNLLRGPASFGAKMEFYSLDAVPSPENAGPGSAGYYSGGYTTKTYKDTVDVIQVEVHYFHRKSSEGRQAYAETLARAIVDFYNKYYETDASKSTQYLQSKLLLVTLNILTIIALYISVQ